jgi:hypothetical protein
MCSNCNHEKNLVTVNGVRYKVTRIPADFRHVGRKTRIYVWSDPSKLQTAILEQNIEAAAAAEGCNTIYTVRGASKIVDRAWDKLNRFIVSHKRKIAKGVLEQMFKDEVKINWSKHAGCSMCPCSPGFIATGLNNFDIFIEPAEGGKND